MSSVLRSCSFTEDFLFSSPVLFALGIFTLVTFHLVTALCQDSYEHRKIVHICELPNCQGWFFKVKSHNATEIVAEDG